MSACERYQLSADAPFDTRFVDAKITAVEAPFDESRWDQIDTSQRFHISYVRSATAIPWSVALNLQLMTVYTGVARASVLASKFIALCVLAGFVRVLLQSSHYLISVDLDGAASLLLLFPGIAASAVAGAARNTLTATLQFPMRLTLWAMSLVSFVLATAAAFGLAGLANVLLWGAATVGMLTVAGVLQSRSRQWAAP